MNGLKNYRKILGNEVIDKLFIKAEKLSDKHLLTINSTDI